MRLEFWSYRAVPAAWTGQPTGSPLVVAGRQGATVHMYASWNGATQISRWQVLAGSTASRLSPAGGPVPFADLETRVALKIPAPYVAVQALDARGGVLGTSAAVRVR